MAPSGGGGGLQAEGICFFVFLLGHQATQALEVMEQCRVENRRTGEKAMANIKGTLVYTKQIQTLKADFWKEGVGGSKKLLKKILKKITNYEAQHVNLDEQVNKKLGKRFKRLGKEDVWYDQAEHRPVYKVRLLSLTSCIGLERNRAFTTWDWDYYTAKVFSSLPFLTTCISRKKESVVIQPSTRYMYDKHISHDTVDLPCSKIHLLQSGQNVF